MNYTENYKGIKVDIQSVDMNVGDSVQQEVRSCLDKLLRFTPEIIWADVYFKTEGSGNTNNTVGMKLGVPGNDVFAEDNGENLVPMLKSVTDKLVRQLQKNKG
ncbi:ribosome hibernation-promoting factor, HPF/YfiA family [Anditalea andensis]|uniref:30S ribosomal protein S30 n=1 Tax=Anditalea andensis TaxID=1048983 RepID=A0A074KX85_9BACT|nr:ribosome-associated translation inhibitor RaiA [Anditalea andensis]KEO72840.1 30S ribosomal protein S30 [Anditalea andensis]